MQDFFTRLKRWFHAPLEPDNNSIYTPPVKPDIYQEVKHAITMENKPDLLTQFCLAIQNYEGFIAPCPKHPEGTPAWRNKNPGNIRSIDGPFLVFPTYEAGFAYLKKYVIRAATNKHFPYKSTNTLPEYFAIYSPTLDHNNPELYAETVAKEIKVDINTFTINKLLPVD